VGFGTEILFLLMLGLLVLGPKRLYTMVGHVARAKAQFEDARRGFKSQLIEELDDAGHHERKTDVSHESVGGQ
jgi:Sec-independent protein translocase protein TatA